MIDFLHVRDFLHTSVRDLNYQLIMQIRIKKRRLNEGFLVTHLWPGFKGMTGKRFVSLDLKSAKPCKLKVINNSEADVVFCWVDFSGKLYHFSPINNGSISDGSVKNIHIENTTSGHSFVGFKTLSPRAAAASGMKRKGLPEVISEISASEFVFFYRPEKGHRMHELELSCQNPCSIVTKITDIHQEYSVTHRRLRIVDSTCKPYETTAICGFTVKYEVGLFEDPDLSEFKSTFTADLEQITQLLSQRYAVALQLLRESTAIWVNRSLVYGEGVQGRACCFHAHNGQAWLRNMGCHVEKAGGIEIYSARDYLTDRSLWGVGGILMHELSHSYHNQHVVGGFENKTVLDMYASAMAKKLYHSVAVHGSQGRNGPIKAYACANAMEFFAEISTAYMWGAMCMDCPPPPTVPAASHPDRHLRGTSAPTVTQALGEEPVEPEPEPESEPEVLEYNKWFPFNRRQLVVYDYDTYIAVDALWTQTAAVKNASAVTPGAV